jgi:hypothetical protein
MKLRQLLPVIVSVSLCIASENPIPPRATRVGHQFVLVIPYERIDPGDRRPH